MLALVIVLAVLLTLALLRVGVIAEYSADGLSVAAKLGPIKIRIIPSAPRKKAERKKKKEKPPKDEKKKPGKLSDFTEMLPSIKSALSKLRRKLLIRDITVHFIAASDNPASAALTFGAASAVFGMITPLLESHFRVKKRDFRTAADFGAAEPYIYVRAALSLAIWEIVYIASGLLVSMLKSAARKPNDNKGELKDGEASNR